ncbi:endonuclease [Lacinutrix iliipiscaria]|uniref:Endonuclease n=1 Tax=Lacinutrix iliipiscaria TaxID=1230532 RepID=A0ABW5WMP8_9FLAO
MKQFYTLVFCLFGLTLFAQQPYYDDVDLTLTGEALYIELQNKISTYNTSFTYGDNRDTIKTTDDEDFNDADGSDTSSTLWLIYGHDDDDENCTTDLTRDEDSFGGTSCLYNREHTFARGLASPDMGTASNGSTGIVADPHNVRPSDQQMNNNKGNLLFTAGTGVAGNVGGLWYPGDEWKGDVARIIMYMYTRYGDQCLPELVGTGPKEGTTDMLQLLLQWNIEDDVSSFEMQRNDYLETVYLSRNPFIDNPALATVIWGGDDATDTWGVLLSTDEFTVNEIKMFPNPVKGQLLNIHTQKDLQVDIYDILGKRILKSNVSANNNKLNVSSLSKGVYLVRLKSNDGVITKKLIKQ